MQAIQWDGTQAHYENVICDFVTKGASSLAIGLCKGKHITIPTRTGFEYLYKGDWLVKDENNNISVLPVPQHA